MRKCLNGHFKMDIGNFDDIKTVVISIVIILNITLNVIVIAVIVRNPQLREDRTTLFMLSLSLSDLANGCTAMPISAAVCSKATPNVRNMVQYLPKINEICSVWFNFNSMHSLCWVTVCKMVAVTKPLQYEQVLTRDRCYIIIAGIWLFGALIATALSPQIVSWNIDICACGLPDASNLPAGVTTLLVFCLVFGIVLPLIGIVYATSRIYCAIARTHRQIAGQANSIGGHVDFVGNIPSLTLKSIRSGRNVLIICLAYLVLTIPAAAYVVAIIMGKEYDVPSLFKCVAVWTVFCNSFVNSLLYVFLFRYVRSKAMNMFRDFCKLCEYP